MAVPRPVLLALLGLALCAAAFLATRGAQEPGGVTTAPVAPATPPAAEKSQPAERTAPKPAEPRAEREREAVKPAAPAVTPDAATAVELGTTAEKSGKALVATAALDRGDTVVFHFTHAGAADDTGTRSAVKAVTGMKRVTVLRAGLDDLTDYRPILAGAGVTQVPAIVIARKGGSARLLEGYVDSNTLRQTVADSFR